MPTPNLAVAYVEDRHERKLEATRRWKRNNPARVLAATRAWREEHREQWRKLQRNWSRKRYASDPQFKLARRLRIRIWEALEGRSRELGLEELLGCTVKELMVHLESLFSPGMTWENHGDWHVDHRKACATFDLTNPVQLRTCMHFTNLQPLWALDNIRKGDR